MRSCSSSNDSSSANYFLGKHLWQILSVILSLTQVKAFATSATVLLISETSFFLVNPVKSWMNPASLLPGAIHIRLGDCTPSQSKVPNAVVGVVMLPELHRCLPQSQQ